MDEAVSFALHLHTRGGNPVQKQPPGDIQCTWLGSSSQPIFQADCLYQELPLFRADAKSHKKDLIVLFCEKSVSATVILLDSDPVMMLPVRQKFDALAVGEGWEIEVDIHEKFGSQTRAPDPTKM